MVNGGDTLTVTYSTLTRCIPYSFTVAAHNGAGLGTASQALAVTVSGLTTVQVGEASKQYAYSPKSVTTTSDQCVRLNWNFNATNTRAHTVTEVSASNTGLGAASAPLFNSGAINAGGSFSSPLLIGATFYQYRSVAPGDSTSPSLYGSVSMPVVVSPGYGSMGSAFTVQWAPAPLPGYSFTIQYMFKKASATKWPTTWTPWLAGQTGNKTTFIPIPKNGLGMYRFQARIKNDSTRKQGGWSWVAPTGCPARSPSPGSRVARNRHG